MDKYKILLVDDSETNLLLLEAVLGEEHFAIVKALSAKEAYDLLENLHPDLILLDLLMPNENGFDVLKKLRLNDIYNDIPIIIVTAFANAENKEKANQYGVFDVIEKPIDIPVFLEKVKRALKITENIV
ncbi:MAG: response regulator [Bacteroidales bacterium]|jgi:CheY-like chemotaxis protein|nr:response regulator [Bacteroidales bacterium]